MDLFFFCIECICKFKTMSRPFSVLHKHNLLLLHPWIDFIRCDRQNFISYLYINTNIRIKYIRMHLYRVQRYLDIYTCCSIFELTWMDLFKSNNKIKTMWSMCHSLFSLSYISFCIKFSLPRRMQSFAI